MKVAYHRLRFPTLDLRIVKSSGRGLTHLHLVHLKLSCKLLKTLVILVMEIQEQYYADSGIQEEEKASFPAVTTSMMQCQKFERKQVTVLHFSNTIK